MSTRNASRQASAPDPCGLPGQQQFLVRMPPATRLDGPSGAARTCWARGPVDQVRTRSLRPFPALKVGTVIAGI